MYRSDRNVVGASSTVGLVIAFRRRLVATLRGAGGGGLPIWIQATREAVLSDGRTLRIWLSRTPAAYRRSATRKAF